jgi:hypothetical protein
VDAVPLVVLALQRPLAPGTPHQVPLLPAPAHFPQLQDHREVLLEVVLLLLAQRRQFLEDDAQVAGWGERYVEADRKAVLKT